MEFLSNGMIISTFALLMMNVIVVLIMYMVSAATMVRVGYLIVLLR